MKKILIVGASGFLGWKLYNAKWEKVKIIGTYFNQPKPGLHFLNLSEDICSFVSDTAPDIVLYAAGLTDVDQCENEPQLAYKINCDAIQTITRCTKAKIVYFSTDYVFNGEGGNYTETDQVDPLNCYGKSKLEGENIVLRSSRNNIVIRVSGLFDIAGQKNKSQANEDDDRFSSPVSLDDVVTAVQLLIRLDANGLYHVAGELTLSRYEFSQILSFYISPGQSISPSCSNMSKNKAKRPKNSSLSTEKMKLLGWNTKPIYDSLLKVIRKDSNHVKIPNRSINCPEQILDNKDRSIKAVFIDCVGALLAQRIWLPPNPKIDYVDELLGKCISESEMISELNKKGIRDEEYKKLIYDVASKYAPNPSVWKYLNCWKKKYKLALVNNGSSKTFRIWVKRYGLEQIFDLLVNSEEIGNRKPSLQFFEYITKTLDLELKDCLLIDDQRTNTIGAQFIGMRGIRTIEKYKYPFLEYEIQNV